MSGHIWASNDKCELCGDRDWYADKYCSKSPAHKKQYEEWLSKQPDASSLGACSAVNKDT